MKFMGPLAIGVIVMFLGVAKAKYIGDPRCPYPMVPEHLELNIYNESIYQHMRELNRITLRAPQGHRLAGSVGANETIKYIWNQLIGAGYQLMRLPYSFKIQVAGGAEFSVGNEVIDATQIMWSPDANYTNVVIVPIKNSGCSEEDYPRTVSGKVVLVSSEGCLISAKSRVAKEAGAIALVVYESTELMPSLGGEKSTFIPSIKIPLYKGLELANATNVELRGNITSWKELETVYSANIIATWECFTDKKEERTLMLGAHSDSVRGSPGMNDDGSGVAALLEIALQLSKHMTVGRVRFAFWTAEESGQLGARAWIDSSASKELDKIQLYLDTSMIASPNGFIQLWGGINPLTGLSGPEGSDAARDAFGEWFKINRIPYRHANFSGRSSYQPFLEAGVPCAGIFTGANGLKTAWEVENSGGAVNEPYDPNYHSAADTLQNINSTLLYRNTVAMSHIVAAYARNPDYGNSPHH
ncbi:hypothetical protein F5X99DRAFT_417678 [Biscogniauxia marginata]|nr:hypothetical protein F5X99DRAFT_417678 [Biscogniauxia marginata]